MHTDWQPLEQENGDAGTVVIQQGKVRRRWALDGKTVWFASTYGTVVHLVSVVNHESGLVPDQAQMAVNLNEWRIARQTLLHQIY